MKGACILLAGVLAAALLSATAVPALPAPLVVQGVGTGASASGGTTCAGHPLVVQLVYLPGDEAVVSYEYAGTGDCPLRTGGGVAAGQVAYDAAGLPPVRYQASCRGTPASGLACEGGGATVVVSPYRGPGSQMTLLKRGGAPPGNTGDFAGTFLAL